MSKKSPKENEKKPVPSTTLGVVFLFIAILIMLVGYIVHLTNLVSFSIMMPDDVLEFAISHIDLYCIEYITIGFFTGIFLVLGIVYLKKPKESS